MTLERARIIKRAFTDADATRRAPLLASSPAASGGASFGRRIAREVMDARAEAERILDEARQGASRVAEEAARDARAAETARLAAQFLALRSADEARADRDLDRVIDLATLLAERLVGEGLRLEPSRVAELAANALAEARGVRRVRIDASPDDVDVLRQTLASLGTGHVADVQPDAELPRGSLVLHTDLGVIDARLRPQLERLAAALREAMR